MLPQEKFHRSESGSTLPHWDTVCVFSNKVPVVSVMQMVCSCAQVMSVSQAVSSIMHHQLDLSRDMCYNRVFRLETKQLNAV